MSDEYKPIGPLIDEVSALRTQLRAVEAERDRLAQRVRELEHIGNEVVSDWEMGGDRAQAVNDSLHELRAALASPPVKP